MRSLSVEFLIEGAWERVVDSLSFHVAPNEVLGIVGESGSGKSVAVTSVLRLLPPTAQLAEGEVFFRGEDLLRLSRRAMRLRIRGGEISMVFQDPLTSLNPVLTVGEQIAESVRLHSRLGYRAARDRAVELMDAVGIRDASRMAGRYPHQFSGGMRQRVMIAIALAGEPSLIIADEPTTALDVTIQKQIMDLLGELRSRLSTSILFISHDLDLVAEIADRIMIMYAGECVEQGRVQDIFNQPLHPYTQLLLRSVPRANKAAGELPTIAGVVPSPRDIPRGTCRVAPRLPWLAETAHEPDPQLREVSAGHWVRCTCYQEFRLPDGDQS